MKTQSTSKELVAAGHQLAKILNSASPLLDVAKLVSDLATRLDCAVVRGDELQAQRDALAAENAYLLPKAASELSNAWVLHKYWVGIHAALMHLRVGRIYEVEQWLQNTVAGPGIEAPNLKLTEEIDAWATEQSKDSISHSRALEIMKAETPATDAYLNSLRADAIPENLKVIGELIRTQDNRITDQPMFVVFEKREIIGSDEHSPSRIVWVWEGEEVDELRGKRLELLYQDGRDTRGYDRYAMQEIDVFVTACFTEQGCKDFLSLNGHNLRQPFIYADGSFRNNEYRAVRNWLMSLPEASHA